MDLRQYIRHLPSQESVACCTSSASLLALETMFSIQGTQLHLSRLYLYYMTRKLQGRIGQRGAELKYTLEALAKFGVCSERRWPFRHKNIDIEPNLEAIRDAAFVRINGFSSIPYSNFNNALDNNMPIIIGMFTGRKFWKIYGPLADQNYCPINSTDNRLAFGHAVTAVGYNDKGWIIANSTGLKWGDKGYGVLPYACYVDIGEAYVIDSFSNIAG